MKSKKDRGVYQNIIDKLSKKDNDTEDDVPSCNTESIESFEMRTGHGFWGNSHSGYITDEQLKDM